MKIVVWAINSVDVTSNKKDFGIIFTGRAKTIKAVTPHN
jgi:hypothetical protein